MARIRPATEVVRLLCVDDWSREWTFVMCSDGRVLFSRYMYELDGSFAWRGTVKEVDKRTAEYLKELVEWDSLTVVEE